MTRDPSIADSSANPSQANRSALLTGTGAGAIAVIRLIGPLTPAFLATHFTGKPRRGATAYGRFRDRGQEIDDGIVVLASEQVADLNVHGGPWVVSRMLQLANAAGFRPADGATMAEEFGDNPIEREVAAALPLARTELGLRALLAQPQAWTTLQKPRTADPDSVREVAEAMLHDHSMEHLLRPPTVAIVGLPNAGKSTLANALFGRARSIVADLPGTTRDWVGDAADVDGLPLMLLDTPGLRDTDDTIERSAIVRAAQEIDRADLIVLVLDASRPLEPDQAKLLERFKGGLHVVNQIDRQLSDEWRQLPGAIATVATTELGLPELRACIADRFDCRSFDVTRPRCWTERQRNWLTALVNER